jgi:4-carboxymuconolactone decarboxylase
MTRIKILERGEMNEEQGRVYDEAKASGGPVGGPYIAYIRHPAYMRLMQDARNCLSGGPLSARERQIAHLAIARHWGAKYPWFAQARASLDAGVEQEIIDAINARRDPGLGDPRERAALEVAKELLADHGMSDATYATAEASLGLDDLVALVATVGQFSMTCCTTNAFDVSPPDDAPTPLAE